MESVQRVRGWWNPDQDHPLNITREVPAETCFTWE
ncbi:hypothetical protein P378_07635 [Desulforamulus profundi]|uniref:Uncharacterized protein n=1 Tax=Desulforamulus profundi TaxID=1383067 RepID=A0A2C6L363_9FIRM|nr:hypothetical protein P378_07635 [Desulforamulus profundi]